MGFFRLGPTKTAEWQSLVVDAENQCGYHFDENLESYLVLTLDYYTTHKNLSSSIIAVDFLKALDISGKQGGERLREVGDHCLILSGLFPERALKKNVSLNYFISVGKNAYHLLASNELLFAFDSDLFYQLSDNFVGLMDVLHTMRIMPLRHVQ